MKKIHAIVPLVVFVIAYFGFAYILNEINPFIWSQDHRLKHIVTSICLSILVYMGIITTLNTEKDE